MCTYIIWHPDIINDTIIDTQKAVSSPFYPLYHYFDPFLTKRLHHERFRLKTTIFSKSDGGTIWWQNNYKKKFELWSTQKYSQESKICSVSVDISFRVSYMFNPTVSGYSLFQSFIISRIFFCYRCSFQNNKKFL